MGPFLSLKEVATAIRRSPDFVRDHIQEFHGMKFGYRWSFKLSDVEEWIRERREEAAALRDKVPLSENGKGEADSKPLHLSIKGGRIGRRRRRRLVIPPNGQDPWDLLRYVRDRHGINESADIVAERPSESFPREG